MCQFSVYQGRWSAFHRDFERDIIPMCRAEGMGLSPWGSLGGGRLSNALQGSGQGMGAGQDVSTECTVTAALEAVSRRKNTTVIGTSIAYIMHKAPYVVPVLGSLKVEHLMASIAALSIDLSTEDIQEIEAAAPFDLGFPNNFLWGKEVPAAQGNVHFAAMGGTYDHVEDLKVRHFCDRADSLIVPI